MRNKSLFLIAIFISFFSLHADELDFLKKIEWEAIEGASSYIFKIKKDNITIVEKKLNDNFIELNLYPGTYQFQVIVLNRFQKEASKTTWQTVTVKVALRPIVKSVFPNIIYTGAGVSEIKAIINNLLDDSLIYLVDKDNTKIVQTNWERKSSNEALIVLDTEHLEIDYDEKYSLLVVNPSGLEGYFKDVFLFEKAWQPEIKSISLDSGYTAETYRDIVITGENFKEGCLVFLENSKNIIRADYIKRVNENQILVDFHLRFNREGIYNLLIINPSGLKYTLEESFTIKPYKIENLIEMSFNYVFTNMLLDKKITEPVGDTGLVRGNKFFNSITGFGLTLDFGFGNKVFHDLRVLKDLGVQFDFLLSFVPDETMVFGASQASHNFFVYGMLGANIFYKSNFDFPLNFALKTGFGVSFLDMNFLEIPFVDDFIGYKTLVPYLNFGADGIIRTRGRTYFSLGFAAKPLFYPNSRVDLVLASFLGIGVSIK